MRSRSNSVRGVGRAAPLLVLAFLVACSEPTEPRPGVTAAARASGSTDDPTVKNVDPDSATQDTTLDIVVSGSGYGQGSQVQLELHGVPSEKIRTNSTVFVNSRKLVANITITADADTGAYDVAVMTLDGRRGIGIEMFTVRLRNNLSTYALELSEWTGAVWSPVGALTASFTTDGRLWMNTEQVAKGGKRAAASRELCVDLSQLGGEGILDQVNYDLFVQLVGQDPTSAGMGAVCTLVTLHTRDHSNADQMSGQSVGTLEHAGGKIVLKDFATGNDSWEWRLIWDAAGPDSLATDRGQGVCTDRPELVTWHVYNDDDIPGSLTAGCAARGITVDNVGELWRLVPTGQNEPLVWIHVAEFAIPFRFRVRVLQ